jgi:hypothetical protein
LLEYEEDGVVYVEGTCLECERRVRVREDEVD